MDGLVAVGTTRGTEPDVQLDPAYYAQVVDQSRFRFHVVS
jgi:hypothetical protein